MALDVSRPLVPIAAFALACQALSPAPARAEPPDRLGLQALAALDGPGGGGEILSAVLVAVAADQTCMPLP